MNRKQRRAQDATLDWYEIKPKSDYAEALDELGTDAVEILLIAFRSKASVLNLTDEQLFNSHINLIRNGYLSVFVAFKGSKMLTRIVPKIPGIGTIKDYLERSVQ